VRAEDPQPSNRLVRLLLAALALGGAAGVRAEGLSAHLEPGYVSEIIDVSGPGGPSEHRTVQGLTQNYQLAFDRALLSNLRLSAGGNYRRLTTWTDTNAPVGSGKADDLSRELYARLALAVPTLRVEVGVDQRLRDALTDFGVTSDVLSFTTMWRPVELPEVDLLASRTHDYGAVAGVDVTTTSATFGTRYVLSPLDLRYLVNWADRRDDVALLETQGIEQRASATYADTVLAGRSRVYASASVSARQSSVLEAGPTAKIEKQQFPIAGLSLVETIPQPTAETLLPNPALIDGDLRTSAGLNIGYRPSLAGDVNLREVGGRFADLVTDVNVIYVWTDRRITPDVARLFTWTAYESNDNFTWAPVGPGGIPGFSPIYSRFEIPIPTKRARYLKVTVTPLAPLTDPQLQDIFITEVQFALLQTPAQAAANDSSTISSFTGSATTALLRGRDSLTWDLAAETTHMTTNGLTIWSLMNGLTYQRRVGQAELTGRASRRDQDPGTGHEGQTDWAASLATRPIPAIQGGASYSGSYNETTRLLASTLTGSGRAEIWEGIAAQATGSANVSSVGSERATFGRQVNLVLSLTPNRVLGVTTGWIYSSTTSYEFGTVESTSRYERVDLGVTVTPGPALSFAGSVSRVLLGPRPTTLATLQLSASPFRGDLQLSFLASRTLDTAAESTSTLVGPNLRWNVRRNLYVNASYTWLQVEAPILSSLSRVLSTSLVIYL
jgi:hypothetical protein